MIFILLVFYRAYGLPSPWDASKLGEMNLSFWDKPFGAEMPQPATAKMGEIIYVRIRPNVISKLFSNGNDGMTIHLQECW
jgi:hypothetical protein